MWSGGWCGTLRVIEEVGLLWKLLITAAVYGDHFWASLLVFFFLNRRLKAEPFLHCYWAGGCPKIS